MGGVYCLEHWETVEATSRAFSSGDGAAGVRGIYCED